MNKLGFKKSAVDHSVFYCRSRDKHTMVAVEMDDMAITSKHKKYAIKQDVTWQ